MSWTDKYKRSIDCNNPKGFSQRAHCQGRKKKIEEDLRNWFSKSHPEGNWKRYNTKGEPVGPCAREPGESKPKCLSNEKAAKMSKKEIASAVRRKREEDPVANRRGKGGKPKMVSNRINEQKTEETRYCKLCGKYETQKECSYGPEMWIKFTKSDFILPSENQMKYNTTRPHPANESKEMDHEYSMVRSELSTIVKAAARLKKKMSKGEGNIEAWVQSKITKAADYIDSAADYVDSGEMKEEWKQLDDLLNRVSLTAGSASASYLLKKIANPVVEEKKDSDPCWDGYKQVGMKKKGGKMVPNCVKEDNLEEENKPSNPELWAKWKAKAKAKFDVYPSAYANGWAAKGYKSEGGKWKSVSEGILPEPIDPVAHRKMQRIEKAAKLQKGSSGPESSAAGAAVKRLGGSGISLPLADSYSNWRNELGEDWQKVNRQDKTDGLSQKAVDAYRRENPGSKLQTAVTEKNPEGKRAKRRKNFCSRMKGMKSKLTSSETARDPDSRINKALRRWRCR